MRCSFCSFWQDDATGESELTLDDYREFSRELSQYGYLLATLEGGEPFVRKDVVDIVRAFAEHHLVVIYTNGWFINKELAEELFAAGLHQIGVSVDYPDATVHDRKRGMKGASERAWQALAHLRDAAPHGGAQVFILTVLMQDNCQDLERLLQMSAAHGVGHDINLLSAKGQHRVAEFTNQLPETPISPMLLALRKKYKHLRSLRDYLGPIDSFLAKPEEMPSCQSGRVHFNLDPYGNLSPCIEKTDNPVGNFKREALAEIMPRLASPGLVAGCQDCWTLCRGFGQVMGNRGTLRGWLDMAARMQAR